MPLLCRKIYRPREGPHGKCLPHADGKHLPLEAPAESQVSPAEG